MSLFRRGDATTVKGSTVHQSAVGMNNTVIASSRPEVKATESRQAEPSPGATRERHRVDSPNCRSRLVVGAVVICVVALILSVVLLVLGVVDLAVAGFVVAILAVAVPAVGLLQG